MHSVGLVENGASGEKFFLRKSLSKDNEEVIEMTESVDNTETVAIDEQVERGLFAFFKRFTTAKEDKQDVADEGVEETPDPTPAELTQEKVDVESVAKSVIEAEFEVLRKAYDERLDVLTKSNEDLRGELEKSRKAKEEAEYLEKADSFKCLSAKKSELAKHLQAIAKSAPDSAEYIEGVLKSADEMLAEGGFFDEKGSMITKEKIEILEKAESLTKKDDVSLKDALLSMPKDEQAKYLERKAH